MARNYPRLSIEEFGAHLLTSGDLDPIYIALVRANFEQPYLYRWLIAYWCFYHAGAASWLAGFSGETFWAAMMTAAKNETATPFGERWPRGHERRHFRAAIATSAVSSLQERYGDSPEDMVDFILGTRSMMEPHRHGRTPEQSRPFVDVSKRTQAHRGFGPWIGFKVADMVDRVLRVPVTFDNAAVFMFDDPTEAALKLWRLKARLPDFAKPKEKASVINGVVAYLIEHFREFRAPPFADRPVNLQEVETILCKWKSHMNGHYPLNNDIDEIRAGVLPWTKVSEGAIRFLEAMPQPVL